MSAKRYFRSFEVFFCSKVGARAIVFSLHIVQSARAHSMRVFVGFSLLVTIAVGLVARARSFLTPSACGALKTSTIVCRQALGSRAAAVVAADTRRARARRIGRRFRSIGSAPFVAAAPRGIGNSSGGGGSRSRSRWRRARAQRSTNAAAAAVDKKSAARIASLMKRARKSPLCARLLFARNHEPRKLLFLPA